MKRNVYGLVLMVAVLALAACGPTHKSVFPPLVRVQQLHVANDGSWHMQVRIQNNSYDEVKFTALKLDMHMGGKLVGHIDQTINLDIPELSVDIADVRIQPLTGAAAMLAPGSNSVRYTLDGTATGQPEQSSKPRTFKVHGQDWLSPVPGIPDTWR
jgi:hypothetical protein